MKDGLKLLAESLGVTPAAIVTILVTVLVFISGIIINNLIAAYNSYVERPLNRRLSVINLKQLLRMVYKQAQHYDDFCKQLNIEYLNNYNFRYVDIPSINIFKEIGHRNLFRAYFEGTENFFAFYRKRKLKSFNVLWGIIEYTNNTHRESVTKAENFIKELGTLNHLRNEGLGKVQQNVEEFGNHFHRQLELKHPLGIDFGERIRIIDEYQRTLNPTSPNNAQDYIDKLINLNRENIDLCSRYERDIKSVQMNADILSATLAFQNFSNLIEASNGTFTHLSKTYNEHYRKMKDAYRVRNYSFGNSKRTKMIRSANKSWKKLHALTKQLPLKGYEIISYFRLLIWTLVILLLHT